MTDTTISRLQARAEEMAATGAFDAATYAEIESFLLANASRLAHDAAYVRLDSTLAELAQRFGRADLRSQQENFGLNSCAQ